jgi:hypothetical protein
VNVTNDHGMEYRKPHLGPYRKVSEACGDELGSCVHTGDHPAMDFFAPWVRGSDTVRSRTPNQLRAEAEPIVPEAARRADRRLIAELRRFSISWLTQSHPFSEARSCKQ